MSRRVAALDVAGGYVAKHCAETVVILRAYFEADEACSLKQQSVNKSSVSSRCGRHPYTSFSTAPVVDDSLVLAPVEYFAPTGAPAGGDSCARTSLAG